MTRDPLGVLENTWRSILHAQEYFDNSENSKTVNKILKVQVDLLVLKQVSKKTVLDMFGGMGGGSSSFVIEEMKFGVRGLASRLNLCLACRRPWVLLKHTHKIKQQEDIKFYILNWEWWDNTNDRVCHLMYCCGNT